MERVGAVSIHCVIDFLDTNLAMNLPHSVISLLHRTDRLNVDVGILDCVHLGLQRVDVLLCYDEILFKLLLLLDGISSNCYLTFESASKFLV